MKILFNFGSSEISMEKSAHFLEKKITTAK